MHTAERVSHQDLSDNYVYQRSILAYEEAAKMVSGNVLEIGTGMGYGITTISPKVDKFTSIDKFPVDLSHVQHVKNFEFKQMEIPPLSGFEDNSFDFVVTFQVIEHIKDDHLFVKEIHRVLKPGGKMIVTTPNIKTSITRNPWHIREYTVSELKDLLLKSFKNVESNGVFGNEKIQDYYEKNKASVKKITRWDIFNLQYNLPRWCLQVPYDILNRMNRRKLLKNNNSLVSDIKMEDYFVKEAKDDCFDLFYIAEK